MTRFWEGDFNKHHCRWKKEACESILSVVTVEYGLILVVILEEEKGKFCQFLTTQRYFYLSTSCILHGRKGFH